MSNLFKEVLNDAGGVEERLLGKNYPYWKNIKSPQEIGMSSEGSLNALGNDVNGLVQYVELLVTGKSNASRTGGPLGNKFFLQTGGQCKDVKTSKRVDRYIYINNVPQGNIPFISSGMGSNFSQFKGLIPGLMGNLNVLNPYAIMQSFLSGSTPDCQAVTLEVIDANNSRSSQSHYVTNVDLANMDPCSFPNRQNPLNKTNPTCREMFTNKHNNTNNSTPYLPRDPIVQLYFLSLGLLGIYIISRLGTKK